MRTTVSQRPRACLCSLHRSLVITNHLIFSVGWFIWTCVLEYSAWETLSKKRRKMEGNTHDVVMLPWSAFGHLTPFFQLSIALAEAGVHVSFISTPKNIQRLPKIPSTLAHLVDFVELPLPSLEKEHLPEGAEATVDLPSEKVQYLKVAYDQLQHPVKQFVLNHSPDWIISDFCSYWVAEIAQEFQVKLMFFSVYSATTLVFLGPPELLGGYGEGKFRLELESFESLPEYVKFPSSVYFRKHEALMMHPVIYGQNASGITDGLRVAKLIDACQAVAIRSCYEIEGEYLNLYQKLIEKPVIPVGLLPPKGSNKEITEGSWNKMFEWLDKQPPKSVVFVGFGSECKFNKDQVFEIAHGLEFSQLPFLWALRKPNWAIEDGDSLPPGFAERTSTRGIVCMGWVPQREILAHPSIGGSLFHSGWGSVIETLQFGHNLVALPFVFDQPLNARFLVDKNLAIEVKRSEDGSFSGDDIAKALKQAMVLDEGEKLRIKTREAAAVVGDLKLQHDHYITEFVKFLKSGAKKI